MVSRMSALVYYLKEDDIKNSDTGEAALLEQDREEEEHVKLLQVKLSYRYHCIMTCCHGDYVDSPNANRCYFSSMKRQTPGFQSCEHSAYCSKQREEILKLILIWLNSKNRRR